MVTRPLSMGTSWEMAVMPPDPRYCPMATSSRKMGMPQKIIEMK